MCPPGEFPNLVLVGARASGKSRAARRLAAAVGWTRVSLDETLAERLGPIPEFVERFGWERFREEESAALAAISGTRLVVDCGGGIVERPENLPRLRALGAVYWVRAPLAVLTERLARPEQRAARPPLPGIPAGEEAATALARRTPLYREAADADVWSDAAGEAADRLRALHFGPRLALVVSGATAAEARSGLERANAEAGPDDLVELRFDSLRDPTREALAAILAGAPPPLLARLIVTVRRRSEGGLHAGAEAERIGLLAEAGRLGAGYLDLESEADRESGGRAAARIRRAAPGARLIASFHDPDGVPRDLEGIPARMAAMRPHTRKVAVRASGAAGVRRVYRLIRREAAAGSRFIGIAMGRPGIPLRVIAGSAGASVTTYAPPDRLPAVASGQLTAGAIRARHRRWGRGLFAPVPVYGVVGSPIRQSLSPPMHEAAFRRLGLDAAYLPFPVPPEELAEFLAAARLAGIRGLNVTIPHKTAVIPLLDALDPEARRIGAVNTIVAVEDRLVGANTDRAGAVQALREVTPLAGRRATVLGAGGSARAVVCGLAGADAEVVVIARRDDRARELAGEFGVGWRRFADLGRATGDILVNATPVGMAPGSDACPAPDAAIAGHEVVFDLVVRPRPTALLRRAGELGKRVAPGLRMLIHQAAASFARWTGRPPPVAAMTEAARLAADAR